MNSLLRLCILILVPVFVACTHTPKELDSTETTSPTITAFTLYSVTIQSPPTIKPGITSSPTIFPTKKSHPTLSGLSADEVFQGWLSGSHDCILPCWAGVEPGTTSWEDARYQLETLLRIDMVAETNCRFGQCGYSHWDYYSKDGTYYGGVIFSKKNVLYSIYLTGEFTHDMNLKRLLETYGQPAQVYIRAASDARGDPPVLDAILLYPKFKFIIKYRWWAEIRKGKIIACGQPKFFFLGIVAIDENRWTAAEIAANGDQFTQSGADIWSLRPITDVTDMTVTDFYNQGIQNVPGDCVSTPSEYWP